MPSASDFAAASDIGGFQDDVELEVPPQGQIPELGGGELDRGVEGRESQVVAH